MSNSLPLQLFPKSTTAFLRRFSAPDESGAQQEGPVQLARETRAIFEHQISKFGDPIATRSKDERELGLLHPVAIAEAMLEAFSFSEEEKDKLSTIIRKTYPRDPTTGYYAKQAMPTIVGLGHLCAKQTGFPVCLVEGDFTNMAGCNREFSKETTDKLIHEICSTVETIFRQNRKVKEVHCARVGGDETALVVYGMEAAEVEKVLKEQVHPEINLLAAKFGVHNINHTKKDKLPGFGASFACVDLREMSDPNLIKQKLNANIGARKIADGRLRYGMVDEEGITRYIDNFYINELREKGTKEKDIPARVAARRPKLEPFREATAEQWQELSGKGGAYEALAKEYGTTNPYDFFNKHEEVTRAARQSELEKIHIPPQRNAADKIPFFPKQLPSQGHEDPERTRLRTALNEFGFYTAAGAHTELTALNRTRERHEIVPALRELSPKRRQLQQMVVDLMDAFHAPDPSTRCKSTSLIYEDAANYVWQHGGMRVMQFEVSNLTGLNNINNSLADAVLRSVGKFIKEGMDKFPAEGEEGHMADHVYYEGNGRFKVFVPPSYASAEKVEQYVRKQVNEQIAKKPIVEYAEETYAHPSKPPVLAKHENDPDVIAQYERDKLEYASRIQRSDSLLGELESRIAQIQQPPHKPIVTMSQIPHTKRTEVSLGIQCYNKGVIHKAESVVEELARISDEAEKAFEGKTQNQR